jgi:metal-sulfur cluster biosynthetic enzyme
MTTHSEAMGGLQEQVMAELRQVYDPEIPVNIVDLGLIYDVKVLDGGVCQVVMTLTSQSCPEARTIPETMKRRINTLPGIAGTEIQIVWDPMWTPHRISPEGRKQLGMDEEDEG